MEKRDRRGGQKNVKNVKTGQKGVFLGPLFLVDKRRIENQVKPYHIRRSKFQKSTSPPLPILAYHVSRPRNLGYAGG